MNSVIYHVDHNSNSRQTTKPNSFARHSQSERGGSVVSEERGPTKAQDQGYLDLELGRYFVSGARMDPKRTGACFDHTGDQDKSIRR